MAVQEGLTAPNTGTPDLRSRIATRLPETLPSAGLRSPESQLSVFVLTASPSGVNRSSGNTTAPAGSRCRK